MNSSTENSRRKLLKGIGLGSMAGMLGVFPGQQANAAQEKETPSYLRGLPPFVQVKTDLR